MPVRGYAGAWSGGVTGYASSAGFDGIFTGSKPCKAEKKFNPGADLRSVVRKLIRSIKLLTPARRDVDITLGAKLPRSAFVVLKVFAGFALFVAVANISAGEDLAIHWGTALLLLAASAILFFCGERRAKLKAGGFMCFTALLSHGVDKYFWSAVWDHGYLWPYSMKEFQGYGFIGSITPFMNQVATVTFAISGFTAVALLGWHLSRNSFQVIDFP